LCKERMAPAVLRTVAQARPSKAHLGTASSRHSSSKVAVKNGKRIVLTSIPSFAQVAAAGIALAEDVSLPNVELPAVDASAASDIAALFADNPILIGGGALLVALPFGIAAIVKAGSGGSGVKPTSVDRALQALGEDSRVVLLDIRNRAEIAAQGTPNLKSVKRSAVSLPFTSVRKGGEVVVDEAFAEKFARLRGISEESLVILLDADGNAAKLAAGAIKDVVSKIYYVQGGAEVWADSGPWRAPSSGISLPSVDLKAIGASVNSLAEDFKQAPSLTKAGVALAAIAGAGIFLVNEIEVVLELAGVLAAGNFLLKLVLADEREKTLTEIKTLVDEKVAIKEVGSDLNKIAKAVLESEASDKSPIPASSEKAAEEKTVPSPTAPASSAATSSSSETEVPANVKEAKEWIDNWKAKAA
jgi:rhodanese-related sulfurtransferase